MMMNLWARLSANKQIYLFVVITLSYLAKFVIYRYLTEMDMGLDAVQSIGAYAVLVSASMLLGALVWVFRHSIWHILLMLVLDLWMIANILYFSANNTFIDWQVILFAGQLRGFESSILAYFRWEQLFLPLITVLTAVYLFLYPIERTSWREALRPLCWCVGVALVMEVSGVLLRRIGLREQIENATDWSIHDDLNRRVVGHSPAGHMLFTIYEAARDGVVKVRGTMPLTEEERAIMAQLYTPAQPAAKPQGHLVFVLVESLESWALDAHDKAGREVMPCLNNYIRRHPVLLCKNLLSQQIYGRSGDGQLITQTGLLPLKTGVTCMSHGNNTYPNFAHFYPKSIILNPYRGVWNQHVTTRSYGYQRLREPDPLRHHVTDSLVFVWTREALESADEPLCALAITITTHAPFRGAPTVLELPDTYSRQEADYLQCAHFTDRHLGRFLAWADTAAVMREATVIITADHNHFPLKNGKGRCPLIICGPAVEADILVPEAYQMDIFPTVCAAIGQQHYAWHGLGVNLLNPSARRPLSVRQAQDLSDKLIRNNYFSSTPK